MDMITQIVKELEALGNPEKARLLQRFFKTSPGEYGEGDVFLGVKVPESRVVAKKYKDLPLTDVKKLLDSRIHEHRLAGLLILVHHGPEKKVVEFYLKNTSRVNNWDLVDLSADKILGSYLLNKPARGILYRFARSKSLWERRISIVATFAFIREGKFSDTLKLAELLLNDREDLIHKAVGWMLREVGKRDQEVLESFLKKHSKKMPRTMLRYSLERLPEKKRIFYMKKS